MLKGNKQELTMDNVTITDNFGDKQEYMRYLMIAILTWLFVQQTSGQSKGSIHLTLNETNKDELFYTILLKRIADSSLVKIETTVAKQEIHFNNIPYGDYFLHIICFNKLVFIKPGISLSTPEFSLGSLVISESTKEIKEVKVTAQKNILERRFDKLIYNVENTLASPADDAIAILQKAPAISVDNDGNISMRGKVAALL